jgi:hypothetical protein
MTAQGGAHPDPLEVSGQTRGPADAVGGPDRIRPVGARAVGSGGAKRRVRCGCSWL